MLDTVHDYFVLSMSSSSDVNKIILSSPSDPNLYLNKYNVDNITFLVLHDDNKKRRKNQQLYLSFRPPSQNVSVCYF
jgi:hypothetical protein